MHPDGQPPPSVGTRTSRAGNTIRAVHRRHLGLGLVLVCAALAAAGAPRAQAAVTCTPSGGFMPLDGFHSNTFSPTAGSTVALEFYGGFGAGFTRESVAMEVRRDGVLVASRTFAPTEPNPLRLSFVPPAPGTYTVTAGEVWTGSVGYPPAAKRCEAVVSENVIVAPGIQGAPTDPFDPTSGADPVAVDGQPAPPVARDLAPSEAITVTRRCLFVRTTLGDEACRRRANPAFIGSDLDEDTVHLRVRMRALCAGGTDADGAAVPAPITLRLRMGNAVATKRICGTVADTEQVVALSVETPFWSRTRRPRTVRWTLHAERQRIAEGRARATVDYYYPARTRTITERNVDDFFNECLDDGRKLVSVGGVLRCYVYDEAVSSLRVRLLPAR